MRMKIYLDLIFITNFIFDFIILLVSSLILKRNIKVYKIILGALFGSITLLSLFIRFNTFTLFLFKIVVSLLIILITYGFINIRYFLKNLYYFYMISIILGGIIFFFNNQFSYNDGFIFYNTYSLNIVLSIVIGSIGLSIYFKNVKDLKTNYNKYLKAKIYFKNYNIDVVAFVDTGNKLIDPYFLKPIILVNRNVLKENNDYILVPYKSCNNNGLLKCIKAEKIYIEGIGYKRNFLVGLSDSIKIDGINCLLNERLLEG